MKSLRFYLVFTTLSVIIMANFIAAVAGYRQSISAAESLLDAQLKDYATLIFDLANSSSRRLTTDDNSKIRLFKVWDKKQQVILSSNQQFSEFQSNTDNPYFYENFAGYRWRFYQTKNSQSTLFLLAGERADQRTKLAEKIAMESVTPLVSVIPIIGILIWIVVQRSLSSLNQLSHEITEREPTNLSAIEMDFVPEELTNLVNSTNLLLARLSEALARERRFTSDSAHELRTPIATLKVLLENHQHQLNSHLSNESQLSTAESLSDSLRQVKSAIFRLQHLAEQLLVLHRNTIEQNSIETVPLKLDEEIRQNLAELYPLAESKNIVFDVELAPVSIRASHFSVNAMISNVLSNAIKYTPVNGQISVRLQASPVTICIEDNGTGVAAEFLDKIFDRFYRAPTHQSSPGCGLGLAIVKQSAELLSAQLVVGKSEKLGGFKVEIAFLRKEEGSEQA